MNHDKSSLQIFKGPFSIERQFMLRILILLKQTYAYFHCPSPQWSPRQGSGSGICKGHYDHPTLYPASEHVL